MCGIIAAVSLDGHNVNEEVCNQFQDQSSRGTRGFGAAMLESPEQEGGKPYIHVRRSTDEIGAMLDLKLFPSTLILFHHRTPTSSDNKIQQTHPILVSHDILQYDWLIAHNGMINNDDETKEKHYKFFSEVAEQKIKEIEAIKANTDEQKAWKEQAILAIIADAKYSTDNGETTRNYNDSETVATEIALFLERAHLKATLGIDKDGIEAKGSAAIIGLQLDKATKQPLTLFYGKNGGNPLRAYRDQRVIFISSEGKGELVSTNEFTMVDLTHKNLKQKKYTIIIPYTYYNNTGFDANRNGISLPNRTSTPVHVESSGKVATDDRHWPDQELNEGPTALEESFSFTSDPNLQQTAEEMYDELETIAQEFIETICSADSIDYSDSDMTQMRQAMEKQQEKMKDYWTNNILENEQAETDKTVVEAARDQNITVTPETEVTSPPVPAPHLHNPGKIEEALQGS